jgi:hypothetical protein
MPEIKFVGKPSPVGDFEASYEGKLHVRFDEGEWRIFATLYSTFAGDKTAFTVC